MQASRPACLVAGVDSSTQATKVLVVDAGTGRVVRSGRAPHPDGTEVDPEAWWAAYRSATGDGLLDDVAAIGVAAQQHGMVALDERGEVVRPALLWNDTRSAGAAGDLVAELGGPRAWASAVGSVPVAAFTISKLRWLAEHEPAAAARTAQVLLPHDWVSRRVVGDRAVRPGSATTDRGDASGTGYWSPETGDYRPDLLRHALGAEVGVPRVLGPDEPAGETSTGVLVAAGTGDNMGAALGLGLVPGDVVVSLGTSGTVFAVHDAATHDPSGLVAGFADAAGAYLPLVCTLNAARVLTSAAALLGTDLAGLDALALEAQPGAGGLVLLPYLDGERTPDLPTATGTLGGLTRAAMTPANLARAAVEGMLCGLAEGLDALRRQGVRTDRVVLVGGAARSEAVQAVAPQVLGLPVLVPPPAEYVALGAARQAAAALAGTRGEEPPGEWSQGPASVLDADPHRAGERIRAAYAELRGAVHPGTRG